MISDDGDGDGHVKEVNTDTPNDDTSTDTAEASGISISQSISLAAAVRKLSSVRKKIGRSNLGKLSTTIQPPLWKATQPSAPLVQRPSKQPNPSNVDNLPT